jgi:Holliday junction resolvasome RuvABC ATP-dependent DNA helicase subunit
VTRLFLVFASASGEGKTIISHISAETLNAEIACLLGLAVQRARVLIIPANFM